MNFAEIAIRFDHPWRLLLLIPALALTIFYLKSRLKWWQFSVLAAGVFALADPVMTSVRREPETIVLCDLDRVPDPAELTKAHPGATLKTFRGDPAAALAAAGASLPERGGTIHIYGGLDDPAGSAAATAKHLARRGIPVYVQLVPRPLPAAPMLRRLEYPPVAGVGETVMLDMALASPDDRRAELAVADADGNILASRKFDLRRGDTELRLPLQLRRVGEFTGTLRLDGRAVAQVPIRVDPPLRALVFSGDTREVARIAELLAPGIAVEPYDGKADPNDYPLVVFGENAVGKTPPDTLERVAQAAAKGTGVFFFAGRRPPFVKDQVPRSFARLLPLEYHASGVERSPDVALVIIIDTSGSMGGGRLDLAREVARLAADKLRDRDLCGIIEFHGRRRWAAPLQSAANRMELHRALNRLTAGGGTLILPALREADYALRNADARLKHVLVITDGGVERGDFETLIRDMARHDITVSTVMAGAGDSAFLASLARWGNGNFYRAATRFAVPELSFAQAGREQSPPWRWGAFPISSGDPSVPQSVLASWTAPGVMESTEVRGAKVPLRAGGRPLLAVKTDGCGSSAVVNLSTLGREEERLLNDPFFRGLLSATLRNLADPVRRRRFDFRNFTRRRTLHIVIDRDKAPEGLYLTMRASDGSEKRFTLKPEADGAFHFRFADAPVGIARITVEDARDPAHPESIRVAVRNGDFPWSEAAERQAAEAVNRRSHRLPPPAYRKKTLSLRPVFGGSFIVLMLLQLLLRRLPRNAAVSFFAAVLVPFGVSAGEFETLLLRGITEHDPAALEQAERLAPAESDRKFVRLLRFGEARRQGRLPELLAEYEKRLADDPAAAADVADELEDRGKNAEALALLERYAPGDRPEIAGQMLRLSRKCGRGEEFTRRILTASERDPENILYLKLALYLKLMDGDVSGASALFRRALGRGATPEFVSAAADAASSLLPVADAAFALDRLEKITPDDPWEARFRKVALFRERGDRERALALLREYSRLPGVSPAVKLGIADRAERLGDTALALEVYRADGSGEATIRAAALLEGAGRDAEALAAWEKALLCAENDLRALQAAERMVAIAERTKQLDALYRRFSEDPRLRETPRRRRAYCRILAAAGKNEELFAELEKLPDPHRAKVDRLLELKRWDEAAALIERRLAEHPEERDALLRQLAVIAVESGNAKLAEKTADELFRRPGTDRVRDLGFAAEVYMRTKRPERAAELYAECLKLSPGSYELYLLHAGALKAAGRRDEAVEFFRSELGADAPPEKFGVMVDGLLNMEAPPEVLKIALEATIARIANAPGELFYYRIAEDFADELGDGRLRRQLLLMQLAVAPERRELVLRELFEDARLRNDRGEAEYFARLLVGWNKVYPAELHRALIRTLARAREGFAAAERCARSADEHAGGGHENLLNFIDCCLEFERSADALRICRELAALFPHDETLLDKYALVLELGGEFRAAGELRERQLTLRDARRSPAVKLAPEEKRLVNAVAAYRLLFPDKSSPNLAKGVLQLAVKRRLKQLRALPAVRGAARKPKRMPSSAEEVAASLAVLSDADGARMLRESFDRLPAPRRQTVFSKLPWVLISEPGPEVARALDELLGATVPNEHIQLGLARVPVALQLKRRCADRLRKKKPDSINALALGAATRWAAGDGDTARLLAAEAYERFLSVEAPTLPQLRRMRELGFVYAAAPGEAESRGEVELKKLVDSIRRDRRILGDTPQRAMLEAILLESAGEHDAAADVIFAEWRNGRRTLAVFKFMEELAAATGRYGEFLKLLEAHAPKDQMTEVLYRRRLIQLLRDHGRVGEALMQLPALPAALQRRERMLCFAVTPGRRYKWELECLLLEEARDPRFTGWFFHDFGRGGMLGQRSRRAPLPLPSRETAPELAAILEYLLLGSSVTDTSFAALLEMRRNFGGPRASHFATGAYKTPGGTVLRAALGEPLSPADVAVLEKLCAASTVPAETAEGILTALPLDKRARAAEVLARRMLAGRLTERDLKVLERVLARLDRAEIKSFAVKTASFDTRDEFRLRLYAVLKRSGVSGVPPHVHALANSDLHLALGNGEFPRRLDDFFFAAGRAPEWGNVLPLLTKEERAALLRLVPEATRRAVKRRLLPRAGAVKSFFRLALADSENRELWLKLAAQYDTARELNTPNNQHKE